MNGALWVLFSFAITFAWLDAWITDWLLYVKKTGSEGNPIMAPVWKVRWLGWVVVIGSTLAALWAAHWMAEDYSHYTSMIACSAFAAHAVGFGGGLSAWLSRRRI